MGWFTREKKYRYHFIINDQGKVIGDVTTKMLDFMLRALPNDFKVNEKGDRYIYSGIARKIGEADCGHTMLNPGYKITTASHEG